MTTEKLIELEDNGKGNRLVQFGFDGTFCINNDCPLNMKCFRYDRTDNFQKYEHKRFDWQWRSPVCKDFIEIDSLCWVILNSKTSTKSE